MSHPVVLCDGSGPRLGPSSQRVHPKHSVSRPGLAGSGDGLLAGNQSVYTPPDVIHRMKVPGKMPTYRIEAQAVAALGDRRYEDIHNRR